MEKIIHFTVPKNITPLQKEIIERARALHPTWEIKIWQDPITSDGFLLEKYWKKANSGAQLADLIRLDVIYKWGGIYVDGDLRLLKPLDRLAEEYDVFFSSAFGDNLEGALFGASKAHPAIKALIEDLSLNEPDWRISPDKTTGPDFFARLIRWNKDVTILPRDTFYSYGPDETAFRRTHRHSYGEHLWEVSWKQLVSKQAAARRSKLKRFLRSLIIAGFHAWHRIKKLDEQSRLSQQPRSYPACGEIVVRSFHGFNVVVDGSNTDCTPKIIFGDDDELQDYKVFRKLLRGGDWAIDVGPRAASFCMLAAQSVECFGRVFAFPNESQTSRIIHRSSITNSMHDRVLVRADIGAECIELDKEFPIDLPIRLLKIDVAADPVLILKGARRLLEHRCIDFVHMGLLKEALGVQWRRELGGARLTKLLAELNFLKEVGYGVCTMSKEGLLIEHDNVTGALDGLIGRSIILRARDQYTCEEGTCHPLGPNGLSPA